MNRGELNATQSYQVWWNNWEILYWLFSLGNYVFMLIVLNYTSNSNTICKSNENMHVLHKLNCPKN
jgi:hypothetical protein